jgi:hypothetical protein
MNGNAEIVIQAEALSSPSMSNMYEQQENCSD